MVGCRPHSQWTVQRLLRSKLLDVRHPQHPLRWRELETGRNRGEACWRPLSVHDLMRRARLDISRENRRAPTPVHPPVTAVRVPLRAVSPGLQAHGSSHVRPATMCDAQLQRVRPVRRHLHVGEAGGGGVHWPTKFPAGARGMMRALFVQFPHGVLASTQCAAYFGLTANGTCAPCADPNCKDCKSSGNTSCRNVSFLPSASMACSLLRRHSCAAPPCCLHARSAAMASG